jgi:multiple sugar transport system substrate-binding protein
LALALAPLGARAADLVIWWEQTSEQEDAALRETIAAFERKSGRRVELVFYPQSELPDRTAAIEAGHPPDLAFGLRHMSDFISEWAFEDRLVDVSDTIGSFSNLFDPDALAWWMRVNEKSGQRGLYALPIGRVSNHVHVWTSLLERAGFTVEDIPKRWDAFWSFWCDRVQPAARRATGRDDLWAVGLNMSGEASDTQLQFFQFLAAYDADYVTRDGQLVIDDPAVRRRLVEAIDAYTAVWRKGCTPPGSISWNNDGNNEQFLAAATVMAINPSLSIPNALRRGRPGDHFKNTATIEWPLGPDGEAFPIISLFFAAVVFKDGGHVANAKEFVRFLVAEGWLAHYLDFAGERMLPAMPKLLDAPFWLDPSDRHRMAAVMQIAARSTHYEYSVVSGDWRHDLVWQELTWAKAIHRIVTQGIRPEQAVDEAIVRIKQILGEAPQ